MCCWWSLAGRNSQKYRFRESTHCLDQDSQVSGNTYIWDPLWFCVRCHLLRAGREVCAELSPYISWGSVELEQFHRLPPPDKAILGPGKTEPKARPLCGHEALQCCLFCFPGYKISWDFFGIWYCCLQEAKSTGRECGHGSDASAFELIPEGWGVQEASSDQWPKTNFALCCHISSDKDFFLTLACVSLRTF